MITDSDGYDRLEYYSITAAQDSRRKEFDIKNHTLIKNQLRPDFLFIGDSITHYWELNAYFNLPGQLIVNRGIGGDTTTYLRKRFWVDALQLRPTYCIACIGTNDSIDLEEDYWKRLPGLPYEQVLDRAKENLEDIVKQAAATDTTLILTSLLPINIPVSSCEDLRKQFICQFNTFLGDLCKKYGLIFVNYYPATTILGTGNLLGEITYDGLHPNANGYNIMAAVLKNTLRHYHINL